MNNKISDINQLSMDIGQLINLKKIKLNFNNNYIKDLNNLALYLQKLKNIQHFEL